MPPGIALRLGSDGNRIQRQRPRDAASDRAVTAPRVMVARRPRVLEERDILSRPIRARAAEQNLQVVPCVRVCEHPWEQSGDTSRPKGDAIRGTV